MLKSINSLLLFFSDLLALTLSLFVTKEAAPYVSYWLGKSETIFATTPIQSFYFYFILAGGVLFLLFNRGHYIKRIPWWTQVHYITQLLLIVLVLNGFLYYSTKDPVSRIAVTMSWLLAIVLILLGRQLVCSICKKFNHWDLPTVMISDELSARETLYALSSDNFVSYDVKALLLRSRGTPKLNREYLPKHYQDIQVLDGVKDYADYIQEHSACFYIIALDSFRGEERDKIMQVLKENTVDYALIPPIKRVSLYGMEPQFFFGYDTILLQPKDEIHSPFGQVSKRLLDVFGGITALLLLTPFFIFIMASIRKQGSPVFFGHTRIGHNGKPFTCWKFCTMVPNAEEVLQELLANDPQAREEWEKDFKLKDDPRITPIGKFLRKTSIDEFPQLWNVLKGEMSLVGPRPIVTSEQTYYGQDIDYYLSVKPGITGLWQASGRNDTSYEQRVFLDSWYVRNWSLWGDLVILFKTVRALVFRSGAY